MSIRESGRYFCDLDHCKGRTEAVCCDDEGECVGWCERLHADNGVTILPPPVDTGGRL